MRRAYVHLSDLHFGQERGSDTHLHRDVRERLIDDAGTLAATEPSGKMDGVIVTGDIAFSGKEAEYLDAGKWLDRLTSTVGCKDNDVMVVPGNHDVDRDEITPGCRVFLERILANGEEEMEQYLRNPRDREVLYGRFNSYRAFAEAYACGIDTESGYTVDRKVEVGPNRFLRLIGVNSALACSGRDGEKGFLLLGARQRIFPKNCGEELVVLSHHPLDWLRDSVDTRRFVRARARVFISGHTHEPWAAVERDGEKGDLMLISAGATVPPSDESGYVFTYNKLAFDWDEESNELVVDIEGRTWSAEATGFAADNGAIGRMDERLRCPSFRKVRHPQEEKVRIEKTGKPVDEEAKKAGEDVMADDDGVLRLQFFRDLTVEQRARALAELGVLPSGDWVVEEVTHTLARRLLDTVLSSGRTEELRQAMRSVTE